MKGFLAAFTMALVAAAACTPLVRNWALRTGAVAVPGGRHVHKRTIPRLGGVAICVALFVPLFAFTFLNSGVAAIARQQIRLVCGIAAGGLIMCGIGFLDDTRGMRASHKLIGQLLVSGLAFACGFRIQAV